MSIEIESDKRKSFLLALLIYSLLLVLLFFIRFWPPSNIAELVGGGGGGGMEINFGNTDMGMGEDFKNEELNIKNQSVTTPTPTPDDPIITQDDSDDNTVAIVKPEKVKVKPIVPPKKDVKPIEAPKPKVNNNANDALANILNGSTKGGDGNSNTKGNQGSANGNINSGGYYGNGGSGTGTGGGNGSGNGTGTGAGSGSGSGGGNGSGNGLGNGSGYSLSGRKALSKPSPAYNCNEEGIVVVQITVDKNGNVVEAKPGARGTTNTANCLASQAKIAAMKTKWEASPDGNEKQVGSIRYNFSLKD